MLYPCMFSVALSIDLFVCSIASLSVFVNCLVKQFAICLGVDKQVVSLILKSLHFYAGFCCAYVIFISENLSAYISGLTL